MIAVSKDEVQDVTWRYSADHDALKGRRGLVREEWLRAVLLRLTNRCQEAHGEAARRSLTERRLRELVQLMSPKDKSRLTKEELLGRQSGSAAWRVARGEAGLGAAAPANTAWRLSGEEKESMTFHLEYDVLKVGAAISPLVRGVVLIGSDVFRMSIIVPRQATRRGSRDGRAE